MPNVAASISDSLPLDSAFLYREHRQRVARWVAKLGGSDLDVEDVTQEVFLVAHRERASFRGEAQVTTWLYGITINVARHHRRKERRRQWLAGSADDVAGHLEAPGPTPVDEVERRRSCEQLQRALLCLHERDRAIIMMFEIEGLSGQEIAERVAARPATVWVRLHRARVQLLHAFRRPTTHDNVSAWPPSKSGARVARKARAHGPRGSQTIRWPGRSCSNSSPLQASILPWPTGRCENG